ncbi:hypothetical protein C8Q73DRAFT_663033 [Cubamyces lactineus]|nr:hypothetical protein C8Q73DRAFT_663033 [Cubamyces lactineus]
MHRCPLCPRTFSLPHSLAIHLKWHWGASSLDWKRGISKRCKTIERAFSDAERRRKEAAQQQLVHGFPGMPSSLTMRDMHMNQGDSDSALSSAANPTSLSNDPSHSFIMPIVAQSSFDAFNFSRSPLESPLSANSSYISPNESHLPHAFPPATLASSSTTDAMYDSLPHTPDLLVDTGSSNGASTGRSSPIWSDHLFGPEEDADADAEGENDSGDVLGACLPVSEGIGRFYTTATTERHDPIRTDVTANSGTAEHVFHSRTASTFNSHFTSGPIPAARSRERESVSARVRPPLPRAPRLVPLRLPPMFYEDGTDNAQGDHEAVEEGDAFFASWGHLSATFHSVTIDSVL